MLYSSSFARTLRNPSTTMCIIFALLKKSKSWQDFSGWWHACVSLPWSGKLRQKVSVPQICSSPVHPEFICMPTWHTVHVCAVSQGLTRDRAQLLSCQSSLQNLPNASKVSNVGLAVVRRTTRLSSTGNRRRSAIRYAVPCWCM